MIHDKDSFSALDRVFSVFTTVRQHEGLSILLFSCYGFLLLTSYHVLKTIRETLLLTSFSPQTRSYAVAVIAVIPFVPIFSIIRLVRIFENSADYSLMNTTRQALFLPTDRAAKYEGKMAINTDPGDVITLHARLSGGTPLPRHCEPAQRVWQSPSGCRGLN